MSNSLDNAMIPLKPIWDAINEVSRIQEITSTMAILTSDDHLNPDVEPGILSVVFLDVSERLFEAAKAFSAARAQVKFVPDQV